MVASNISRLMAALTCSIIMIVHAGARSAARADTLSVVVSTAWDEHNHAFDTSAEVLAFTDELLSRLTSTDDLILVNRTSIRSTMEEWATILGSGSAGPADLATANIYSADRFILLSTAQDSRGRMISVRVVAYPSGRLLMNDALRFQEADHIQMISRVIRSLCTSREPTRTLAVAALINATNFAALDEPSRSLRALLEQRIAHDDTFVLLERSRTDDLVDEMRLMELSGDRTRGFDTRGSEATLLITGHVGIGNAAVDLTNPGMVVTLYLTRFPGAIRSPLYETHVVATCFDRVADAVVARLNHLSRGAANEQQQQNEAGQHLDEAIRLAHEAGFCVVECIEESLGRKVTWDWRRDETARHGPTRRRLLENLISSANNALFLHPKLPQAEILLVNAFWEPEIARYQEGLDILLDMRDRPELDSTLRMIALTYFAEKPDNGIGGWEAPVEIEDDALRRLMEYPDPGLSTWAAQLRVDLAERRHLGSGAVLASAMDYLDLSSRIGVSQDGDDRYLNAVMGFFSLDYRDSFDPAFLEEAAAPWLRDLSVDRELAVSAALGQCYMRHGSIERARPFLWRCVELLPRSTAWQEPTNWNRCVHLSSVLRSCYLLTISSLKAGDKETAVIVAERVLRVPWDTLSPFMRGSLDGTLNEFKYFAAASRDDRGETAAAELLRRSMTDTTVMPCMRSEMLVPRTIAPMPMTPDTGFPLRPRSFPPGPTIPITALAVGEGRVWAGGFQNVGAISEIIEYPRSGAREGGLWSYSSDSAWQRETLSGGESTIPVSCLLMHHGKLWVGTAGRGLYVLDANDRQGRHFGMADGLAMESILSLYSDSERIWIGYGTGARGALGWVDLRSMKFFTYASDRLDTALDHASPSFPVASIRRFGNRLYVGEYDVGIKHFSLEEIDPVFHRIKYAGDRHDSRSHSAVPDYSNHVLTLHATPERLWIGCVPPSHRFPMSNGGIGWMSETGATRCYYQDDGLPGPFVSSIIDFGPFLVIGCSGSPSPWLHGGVAIYDPTTDRWISERGFNVLSLSTDGEYLYVGTPHGLLVYSR